MPRKKTKRLQELSTTELLARYERAEKHYIKSFTRDAAEQQVVREGVHEQGRLIPDPIKSVGLRQMETEIKRRTKLHDPEIARQAALRLSRARPLTASEKIASEAIDATVASAGKGVRELDATARVVDVMAVSTRSATPKSKQKEQKEQLSAREKKILAVIQQKVKGLQYCRELDSAGIAPLRSGVWKDCPSRKYESAYKEGQPWRHRIQREKSKVQSKAGTRGLAKLARE
jgi:hypothetical protein